MNFDSKLFVNELSISLEWRTQLQPIVADSVEDLVLVVAEEEIVGIVVTEEVVVDAAAVEVAVDVAVEVVAAKRRRNGFRLPNSDVSSRMAR